MNTDLGIMEGSQEAINAMENAPIVEQEPSSGLFDDEVMLSESMLRGEESAEDKPAEETTGEQAAAPGPEETEADESKEAKLGTVPLPALLEERTKRQELARRIAELEAENTSLKSASETYIHKDPDMPADLVEFKVLNEVEFKDLSEEDPIAANQYLFNLRRFEKASDTITANREAAQHVIRAGMNKLAAVMPDFYEEGSQSNAELTAFAKEIGFSNSALFALTDPATRVILPGQNRAVLLGEAAADLVLTLKNARERIAQGGASENEMRARITQEVTAQVMAKLKAGETNFPPSIGDAPSGASDVLGADPTVSGEEGYIKLSREDQRKWLGG